MAGLDLTAFDSILKIDYLGPVRDQLNNSSVVMAELEKREEEFQGKQLYIPLHTGRNWSIGSRGEDVALPGGTTQGSQQYDNAVFTTSYQYGRIRVTGPTIRSSRNNKGAFIRAVDAEMRGVTRDLRQSLNRQILRNGDGELTECNAGTTTTVSVNSTKYIKVGQIIDIIDQSAGTAITNGDSAAVLTVPSSTTFTLGSAVTTTTDEIVVLEDTHGDDMWGLEAVINTANPPVRSGNQAATSYFGQIDRTTAGNEFWQATLVTHTGTFGGSSGNALDQMQETIDTADIATDSDVNLLITSHALKRSYASVLEGLRRYPPGGETKLSSGYKGLEFNDMMLVADKDAETLSDGSALERIYFVDTSTMWIAHMGDWDWMDLDGAVLSRVQNKDAYEAVLFRYLQLVCDHPSANAALVGIS